MHKKVKLENSLVINNIYCLKCADMSNFVQLQNKVTTCLFIMNLTCSHTFTVPTKVPFLHITMQSIQWLPPAWQLHALTHSS